MKDLMICVDGENGSLAGRSPGLTFSDPRFDGAMGDWRTDVEAPEESAPYFNGTLDSSCLSPLWNRPLVTAVLARANDEVFSAGQSWPFLTLSYAARQCPQLVAHLIAELNPPFEAIDVDQGGRTLRIALTSWPQFMQQRYWIFKEFMDALELQMRAEEHSVFLIKNLVSCPDGWKTSLRSTRAEAWQYVAALSDKWMDATQLKIAGRTRLVGDRGSLVS